MNVKFALHWLLGFASVTSLCAADMPVGKPNIVVILTDDQGYHDLGCQGSTTIRTPRLDQMAAEGLRLTSFYAQPVCGVSRAALMTGSYPIRVAEPGNMKRLHTVPHPDEMTIAESLRSAGYLTSLVGKWHLCERGEGPAGFDPATMPNNQGFDYFFGTPLYNGATVFVRDSPFRSPLLRNHEIVAKSVQDWNSITRDYTEDAIRWIRDHQHAPFFLCLAHNMPHIPLGASADFAGKSPYGPYGDAIEEIDWSTGRLLDALTELGLDEKTLVIFTSDNGPWVETTHAMKPGGKAFIPRDHSGSADPLRGWKMSAWDGGSRVPFLARWPGSLKAGRVSDEILSTMDLLPTFAALAGATLPPDLSIDGRDASAFLLGGTEKSPRDDYLYYTGCLLTGVRCGRWKLVLPRPANPPGTGWWGRLIEAVPETQLFDLNTDPGETANVAAQHPEVVSRLMERVESARSELGDIDRTGTGARFFDAGPRRLQVAAKKPASAGGHRAKTVETLTFEPVGSLRFTFESGDLGGWKIVEGEFAEPVTSAASLPRWKHQPFGREGNYHLSTAMMSGGKKASDMQSGVIESPPFVMDGNQAAFLVAGGFDPERLYVALVDTNGEVLIKAGGKGNPEMRRMLWDISAWKGRTAIFRIVDRLAAGWGHLNVDDISVGGTLVENIPANSIDSPVSE